MKSGYVVSDLHLFAERSAAHGLMDELRESARKADFLVLNGDIFDFRWTVLPTIEDTARAAARWLGDLAAEHPHCRFFYVMGNHDALEPFADELADLAGRTHNIDWFPSHLRLDNALFLHGDLPLRRRRTAGFTRQIAATERIKGGFLTLCYRFLIATRALRIGSLFHRRRRCAKRILRSLSAQDADWTDGITDVYFGHTHAPYSDFRCDGVTFHNTGSAVRGLRCNPLAVRFDREHAAN